ncbi:MAG: DUF3179 domain-containing protein [Methylocystis sp.]|nr:DUF3179 domain-containing protein [Methylocystis sp.]
MILHLAASAAMLSILVTAGYADPARWRREGWKTDFSRVTTPLLKEIVDGGPPRDGIPAIDRPIFKRASEVEDLGDREPVIVFPLGPDARAYPLRVLTWHEIVNDVVGGAQVAVTYCPLCSASIVFDRRLEGRVLDFGTSGKLRHSDLVMYDRQTESWWQQFTGEAIVGALAGKTLKALPSRIEPFREFRAGHADGLVLVPNDPKSRRYGGNPYIGYDTGDQPHLFRGELPEGLPAMARVVVAQGPEGRVSVAMSHLAERRQLTHGGLTFTWKVGTASALDRSEIRAGREVGSVDVVDAAGKPVVQDVTFAFALHAFDPRAVVLTEKGLVRLSDGKPAD